MTLDNSVHAFSDAERSAFVRHINSKLAGNPHVSHLLPLNPDNNDIFGAVKDGILLSELVNASVPETIDESALTRQFQPISKPFQMLENHRLMLNGARRIGCTIVNISSEDLIAGKSYLVFGVLWQIIRAGLLYHVNIRNRPELHRLYGDGEDLRNIPAESLLLKWFNYHTAKAGFKKQISNFGSDLVDCQAYTHLLHALNGSVLAKGDLNAVLSIGDQCKRAEAMLSYAHIIDPTSGLFLTAQDIIQAREKLNLCFVASLFNKSSGLEPLHQELETKIGSLETALMRERAGTEDLMGMLSSLQNRIDHLELENASLKKQLLEQGRKLTKSEEERLNLEKKFKDSLSKWEQVQTGYETELTDLEKKNSQLTSVLSQTQMDLLHEKRQAETFGVCADSLSDELEGFRSRQEKMEYLIQHLKMERTRCDLHSSRLRALYQSFQTTEALCRAIYSETDSNSKNTSLTLEKISAGSAKIGTLTKKARDSNNWRVRFFVLRDNFLFYYKNGNDLRGEPKGVIRLDDCFVEHSDNPTNCDLKGLSVICIQVPNHGHLKDVKSDLKSGRLNFFIAGTETELNEWKYQIEKISGWWTRKSSLTKMQEAQRRSTEAQNFRNLVR